MMTQTLAERLEEREHGEGDGRESHHGAGARGGGGTAGCGCNRFQRSHSRSRGGSRTGSRNLGDTRLGGIDGGDRRQAAALECRDEGAGGGGSLDLGDRGLAVGDGVNLHGELHGDAGAGLEQVAPRGGHVRDLDDLDLVHRDAHGVGDALGERGLLHRRERGRRVPAQSHGDGGNLRWGGGVDGCNGCNGCGGVCGGRTGSHGRHGPGPLVRSHGLVVRDDPLAVLGGGARGHGPVASVGLGGHLARDERIQRCHCVVARRERISRVGADVPDDVEHLGALRNVGRGRGDLSSPGECVGIVAVGQVVARLLAARRHRLGVTRVGSYLTIRAVGVADEPARVARD
mmetsp:Transcript_24971/g.61535  ORF Transcript_24971/g.61535 Transcript_24971/m.61535 type:complete len:345 (-) Transcript_24971:707-1741(-)